MHIGKVVYVLIVKVLKPRLNHGIVDNCILHPNIFYDLLQYVPNSIYPIYWLNCGVEQLVYFITERFDWVFFSSV